MENNTVLYLLGEVEARPGVSFEMFEASKKSYIGFIVIIFPIKCRGLVPMINCFVILLEVDQAYLRKTLELVLQKTALAGDRITLDAGVTWNT